jgi:hypothetical protein
VLLPPPPPPLLLLPLPLPLPLLLPPLLVLRPCQRVA